MGGVQVGGAVPARVNACRTLRFCIPTTSSLTFPSRPTGIFRASSRGPYGLVRREAPPPDRRQAGASATRPRRRSPRLPPRYRSSRSGWRSMSWFREKGSSCAPTNIPRKCRRWRRGNSWSKRSMTAPSPAISWRPPRPRSRPSPTRATACCAARRWRQPGALQGGDRNGNAARGKPSDNANDTQGSARAESAYVARISLADTAIDTEQGRLPLEPGISVTAEIKTGQRRVIEYLLSPLLRYKHEGLRER
jgi:hypothetical protein